MIKYYLDEEIIIKNVIKKLVDNSETKKNNLKFATLNQTIGKLIEKAELLPLSLKQVKKEVVIKQVNFSRSDEEALLAETFGTGVLPYKVMEGSYDIELSSKRISHFKRKSDSLEYWIALEQNSTYEG